MTTNNDNAVRELLGHLNQAERSTSDERQRIAAKMWEAFEDSSPGPHPIGTVNSEAIGDRHTDADDLQLVPYRTKAPSKASSHRGWIQRVAACVLVAVVVGGIWARLSAPRAEQVVAASSGAINSADIVITFTPGPNLDVIESGNGWQYYTGPMPSVVLMEPGTPLQVDRLAVAIVTELFGGSTPALFFESSGVLTTEHPLGVNDERASAWTIRVPLGVDAVTIGRLKDGDSGVLIGEPGETFELDVYPIDGSDEHVVVVGYSAGLLPERGPLLPDLQVRLD